MRIQKNYKKHYIFIDESGTSDVKSYEQSPYFTVLGLVIGESLREPLKQDFEKLKIKYFKNAKYIIHNTEINWHLTKSKTISAFSTDLKKILDSTPFFVISVSVNKEKAFRLGWNKETVLERSYRILISNILKFLVAKNLQGQVVNEASNVEQDIILYKSVFHFLVNGLSKLGISPQVAKDHLTSLSFVTKMNNDSEEQLADLLAIVPRLLFELKSGKKNKDSLNPIQKVLIDSFNNKIFKGSATLKNKKVLYKSIKPAVLLP